MAKAKKKAKNKAPTRGAQPKPWKLPKRRDVIRVIPATKEIQELIDSAGNVCPDPWLVSINGGILNWEYEKKWAIYTARDVVDNNLELGRKVQLVIHKKNGQIQSERTYPRSSDPKRHKG